MINLALVACNFSDIAANLNALSHSILLSALSSLLTSYVHNSSLTDFEPEMDDADFTGKKITSLTKQNATIICNASCKPREKS